MSNSLEKFSDLITLETVNNEAATNVATGDFNGDGFADILVNQAVVEPLPPYGDYDEIVSTRVSLILGQGDGSFAPANSLEDQVTRFDQVVDINQDGITDILEITASDISVLLGTQEGNFQAPIKSTSNVVTNLSFSLPGDFDNDGNLDLIINRRTADFWSDELAVLQGQGDGTFIDTNVRIITDYFETPRAAGDFNNDGKLDFISRNSYVYWNQGDNNFIKSDSRLATGALSRPVVADFNQDNIDDIAFRQSQGANDRVIVLFSQTNGTFIESTAFDIPDSGFPQLEAGDLNGDGLTDLIVGANSLFITVGINNGDGTFPSPMTTNPANIFFDDLGTEDFNGDGFDDIVVAEYYGSNGSVGVLLNLSNSNPPDEEQEIIGTEEDDTLIGNSQDNLIQGLGRRDLLEGKDGADTLDGGYGEDTLSGGNGDDSLDGGGGNDTLEGNTGNDILTDNYGNDLLQGGLGDDFLSAGLQEDWLRGDSGKDTLDGGQGKDTLDGGLGNDRLIGDSERDSFVLRQGDGTDIIVDFIADLNRGQSDRFLLSYGLKVDDFALTRSGNNTEIRFAATNEIVAIVENVLPEEISEGNFIEETRYLSGTADNDTINGGVGKDNISSSFGDDVVRGNRGDDYIRGYLGNDSLLGGADNDTLIGNDGEDTLRGQAGNDSLEGNESNDRLFGNNGDDTLDGGSGNDELRGDLGNDSLIGHTGNDRLLGSDGNDTLQGKADDDFLDGGAGEDSLFGNNGNDFLQGSLGDDTLRGDRGEDTLIGGSGNDNLVGGSKNDLLQGQSNDDFLDGADGLDTLIGGKGSDRFFLRVGAGTDTILDFEQDIDKLVLGQNLNLEQLSLVANGNDTEIQVIATNEVIAVISNISSNTLEISDFLVA